MQTMVGARPAGFTLLEVMIVVVIIGLMSSLVAIVAFPNEDARTESEARRLSSLLELALAETRTSGQSIAWAPEEFGYSFWYRSSDLEWVQFSDSSIFRHRAFDDQTRLEHVSVDGRELSPGARVVLGRYGTMGTIEVSIAGAAARFVIRGGVFGRISLQRIEGPRSGASANAGG